MIVLFLFLLAPWGALPTQEDTERIPLEELLKPRELSRYFKANKYHDRISVLRKAFEDKAKQLDSVVKAGNLLEIYRSLAQIRGLAHCALEVSLQETDEKEKRHREVKRLEIVLRKLYDQMESQRLEVPLENRDQFDKSVQLVEILRDRLLRQLFGAVVGSQRDSSGPLAFSLLLASASPGEAAPAQGLWDLDKWTEEEFQEVQYADKLVKRVEKLLQIGEARLDEIDRRRKGLEWEKEEANPLEFFTYEDLLFGYNRAVEAVMSSIDDRAKSRREPEKEIRNSLKALNKNIEGFLARLEDLEELVREERDKGLYDRWQSALQSSEIARKGARYGLGASDN